MKRFRHSNKMTEYNSPHLRGIEKGTSASIPLAFASDSDDGPSKSPKPVRETEDTVPQNHKRLVYTIEEIAAVFGRGQVRSKTTTLNSTFARPKTLAFILLFKDPAPNYLGNKILAKTNTDVLLNHPLSTKDSSHNTRFPEFSHLDVSGAVFPIFQGRGPRETPGGVYKFWQCLGWFRLSTVQYLEPGSPALARMLQRKWSNKKRDMQRWLEGLMAHWCIIEVESVKENNGSNPMKNISGREIRLAGRSDVTDNQIHHTRSSNNVTLEEALNELRYLREAARAAEYRRETRANERRLKAANREHRSRNEQTYRWLNQVEESPRATYQSLEVGLEKAAEKAAEEAVEETSEESERDLMQLNLLDSPSNPEDWEIDLDADESLRDIPRWLRWMYLPPGSCEGFLPEPNWW